MRVVLREDESGVSEVVGTILILAMTVVLFSSIIIWVTSIPTPSAQTRLDILGTMQPVYNAAGEEIAVNITLVHQGGEALDPSPTVLYITSQQGSNPARTDIVRLHTFNPNLNSPSGLLDGINAIWNVGERWTYQNSSLRSTDIIQVTIVDLVKSSVLWAHELTAPAGTRPPVFIEKWADRLWETNAVDQVESGAGFFVFAKVVDPDGDLNPASVWAILTIWFGTGDPCSQPQQMRDDGQYPDRIASDGIFALGGISCMRTPWPSLQWDGSVILLNATDNQGHATSSRLVLTVVPGPILDPGGNLSGGTGRPQNFRWNGEQGYNVFNASQWDGFRYAAKETRSFADFEEVVIVVASNSLGNIFGTNLFTLYDPFTIPSGAPPQAVIYGADKSVSTTSQPSSNQAFTFLEFVNGYNVYQYRFKLNDPATVGTNFHVTPTHPPNYFYGRYTLDILLSSSTGKRFETTDSIDITNADGFARDFPKVETFLDAGFTQPSTTFSSTSMMYVQVVMFSVDAAVTDVVFANIVVKDFAGGTPVLRAPLGGTGANPPICPLTGTCTGTAISIDGPRRAYRFAINFTMANQDPWLEGSQVYSLSVSRLRDTDEIFSNIATQIVVEAPLYKLDVVLGTDAATTNAWGTKDYSYYNENINGLDLWRKARIEFCSTSCKPAYHTLSIVYVDVDRDGDLDTVSSIFVDNSNSEVVLHRRDLDLGGNIVFTRFPMASLAGVYCNALASGDVTGDGWDEVVCGASNGHVWYYKNDGSWQGNAAATKVDVDQSRTQSINAVAIGDFNGDGANDIAVGGASGRLTWYPNLDKLGRFQNTGIVDNWFADGEQIVTGDISSGSYLNTLVSDDTYEQVREASFEVGDPITGTTTNSGFESGGSSPSDWTYRDWENGGDASGDRQSSGGNPNAYARITTLCDDFTPTSGYFYQAFTTSGTGPFTATLNLDWRVLVWDAGTGGTVQLYAFIDTAFTNPTLGQEVWTSGPLIGTTSWASAPATNVSAKISSAGTYYLKIAFRAAYANCPSSDPSRAGFDNVLLNWSSTGSAVSEMEHYWRVSQLPLRAGTTFTFTLEARRSANTEGDDFVIAYSTDVVAGDPLTGTYTTMITVSATSDTTYSFILPSTVGGLVLWIQALDTDRTTGNGNLDILIVDRMFIRANTPSGSTGVTLTNPSDSTAVNAIDADRQDTDIYWDLAVGTAGGRIFKYAGSPGGLTTPSGSFYSPGTSIAGVKFGNISGTQTGLEIVIAFGSTVRVLTGFGNTGNVIMSALPGYSPTNAIRVLAVGDVDGNGWDDVVVGTTTDVWYWSNRNHGVVWTSATLVDNPGVTVYTLDLGDASKSQYRGR